jgi:hypothetical protein
MATHTPIFSAVRICSPQIIFQGSSARHTSMNADHTASYVSQKTEVDALWSCLLTSLKTPIHNRRMFVNTSTRYEIHKGFRQWFALYPWYDSGGDCKNRQGRDRKVYDESDPPVRQSKQSDSKRNLAQGNSNSIYREFRRAVVHHNIDITQIHWCKD